MYFNYNLDRKEKGLRPAGPVVLAREIGISKTHIYNLIEGEDLNLSMKTLSKIAVFFGVKVEDLLK
jgi:DNA-binding XRE family transcriptional regulator